MSALECLVYLSSATRLLEERDLEALLETSHRLNERDGITGVLLYNDGNVLQYLEGAPEDLDRVFARIKRNPLHHDITEVYRGAIARRHFAGWLMGFARVPKSTLLQLQQSSWRDVERTALGTGAPDGVGLLDALWNDTMRPR